MGDFSPVSAKEVSFDERDYIRVKSQCDDVLEIYRVIYQQAGPMLKRMKRYPKGIENVE